MKTWTPRQIKTARLARRMTQAALAEYLGVTVDSVQNYEQGRRRPRESVKAALDVL